MHGLPEIHPVCWIRCYQVSVLRAQWLVRVAGSGIGQGMLMRWSTLPHVLNNMYMKVNFFIISKF